MYNEIGLLGIGTGDTAYWWTVVIAVIVAYLIGNISPAILIGRAHGIDIKKEGSGNAGTTNVLRVLGKKAAIATLIIDILKGSVAVVLAGVLCGNEVAQLCVLAVFAGHVWPIFFKFKGGKGVATAFGALTAYIPLMGLTALLIVAVGVAISRRMSFGSLLGALTFPAVAYFYDKTFVPIGTVLAILILIKHAGNIKRLLNGEEPKLGAKKKETREDI